MKKGISLTVLVITIIVMIILATTVIISINNTDIIPKADEAVDKTTLENMTEQANIKVAEILSNRTSQNLTSVRIEQEVKEELKKQFGEKVVDNYVVKIEDETVTITPAQKTSSAGWDVQINQVTGYATVVGYNGNGGALTIPNKININGKEVKIKHVDLVGIDFAKIVEDAGEDDITPYYLQDEKYSIGGLSGITSLIISEGIEEVSIFACKNIETITLPSTLKKITNMAANFALTTVHIPEGVTTIAEECFMFDESLVNVTLPSTLTSIGEVALNHTLWLDIQPDGPVYNGNVFIKYKGILANTSTLEIKAGTTVIADGAFSKDRGNEINEENTIKTLILPNTLNYIGIYAFSEFTVTDGFNIPASVISIGRRAFYYANLDSITIPDSVEYIGGYAFANIGGPSINKQINIFINKTERACDTFDTAWGCRTLNNLVEKHNIIYQSE